MSSRQSKTGGEQHGREAHRGAKTSTRRRQFQRRGRQNGADHQSPRIPHKELRLSPFPKGEVVEQEGQQTRREQRQGRWRCLPRQVRREEQTCGDHQRDGAGHPICAIGHVQGVQKTHHSQ